MQLLRLAFIALVCLAAPLASSSAQTPNTYQRDRQSILAMAGNYRVRFDFRETVAFVDSYKPLAPTGSGGFEAIRVIEDSPAKISLQHLLVAQMGGQSMVIKHWRQDWVYQPRSVLTYQTKDRWTVSPVSVQARRGAWSQTVWQTDDSPRYGGVGRWRYDGGVARWTSEETWRPLARRDAIRKPPYDRYLGANRHALTPTGWVHQQDNSKFGGGMTFVHEIALNTYTRSTEFDPAPADKYWAATKDYWAGVRAAWDAAIADGSVAVREEADMGSMTGPRLMELADEIEAGKTTTAKAISEARAVISGETRLASGR